MTANAPVQPLSASDAERISNLVDLLEYDDKLLAIRDGHHVVIPATRLAALVACEQEQGQFLVDMARRETDLARREAATARITEAWVRQWFSDWIDKNARDYGLQAIRDDEHLRRGVAGICIGVMRGAGLLIEE